ncbi:toxin PIN [Gallintestinimicrobium sp.]|uniref:toxin PIN n=1 Tax=Gallintestinimicrobium sp. TaxID=2981655 RepID=UPI003992AD2E
MTEELENSIAGLSQLKPILQTQVMKGNGRNTKQGLIDATELGKHFDTAIDAMVMLLTGLREKARYRMKSKTIIITVLVSPDG